MLKIVRPQFQRSAGVTWQLLSDSLRHGGARVRAAHLDADIRGHRGTGFDKEQDVTKTVNHCSPMRTRDSA